jgi:hypothetical protein
MPLPRTGVTAVTAIPTPSVPDPRGPQPPSAPRAAGEPTTFSRLTRSAATHLGEVLIALDTDGHQGHEHRDLLAGFHAHRHLTTMLGHLGGTLCQPLGTPAEGSFPASRRSRGDVALAARLAAAGTLRDLEAPMPDPGTAAAGLLSAARLIGAAADLWATHHDPTGRPRSPEASRLRHPATLGAATREWRELVVVAAAIADVLARSAPGVEGDDLQRYAATYPQPAAVRRGHEGPVEVTVARPARTRPSDPLAAIEACVHALQLAAWRLATTGTAPVPVLMNLAVVGVMLNRAAALVAQRAACARPADPTLAAAAATARESALAWRRAAAAIAPLRSAHPATTAVQVDRLDLQRLLDQVTTGRLQPEAAETAGTLARLGQSYAEVAQHMAEALTQAQATGEVLLDGRALAHEALARHPELIDAKLRGWAVPSPTAPITRAEAALRAVADPSLRDASPAGPPAA